jgi:nitrogen-specific signal transduction histidine kinase
VQLIDEIQEKSRQLAEASQHKSQFLANMSHELRTPLNAILGYTELILDGACGAMPEKARGVLDRVQCNGKHLLGLINDVLDLSKIEAGQFVLALSDYSLKSMIQTVFIAVESLASEKKIALKVDVSSEMPQGYGDERRLTQVLLNLVGNAIKFTDFGKYQSTAPQRTGRSRSPCATRAQAFRLPINPSFFISSNSPTIRPPKRRAAPGSVWPSHDLLSRCTADASGFSRAPVTARRSHSPFPRE